MVKTLERMEFFTMTASLACAFVQLLYKPHYCHRADVWITCHQFRHTFARHLIEVGVPVTSVQRLLGHARIRTTELYTHISDRKIQADYEAAMAEIGEYFSSDGGVR